MLLKRTDEFNFLLSCRCMLNTAALQRSPTEELVIPCEALAMLEASSVPLYASDVINAS